jgi:uncharacterized protein DUF5681
MFVSPVHHVRYGFHDGSAMMAERERTNRGWFQKGHSGNPAGRPRRAEPLPSPAASLLESEAVAIVRACIERAKAGDAAAMRLCLERILPLPRRGRALRLDLAGAIEPVADEAGLEEDLLAPPALLAPTRTPIPAPGQAEDAADEDAEDDDAEDAAAAPAGTKAAAIDAALAAVVRAMADGAVTPEEAWAAGRVVDLRRRTLEAVEFERRLARLEEADRIIAGVPGGRPAPPVFADAAPGSLWAAP